MVEDSSSDAALLLRHLHRSGRKIHWRRVETAEAMAAALDQGPWDVVLSDYHLPRFSALDALAQVHARDPDMPFIVVSGAIGEETAVKAMRAGAHDYLMKDNLTRLLPAIERELREAAQRRTKRRIEADLRLADAVFVGSQEGIVVTDAQATILRVNPAFTRITGYQADEALGKTPRILRSGRHDAAFYRQMWTALQERGYWQGELWNRRKTGEVYPQWMSISTLFDGHGRPSHFVAVFTDLSEKKDMEARLRHLTRFDALTELPNRALFQEQVRQRIRKGGNFHVYYLGLSGFSRINTSLGHQAGDRVLRLVAQRLRQVVGENEMVARLGGDEFAFMDERPMDHLVGRALASPFMVDGKEVFLNPVMGSATYPADAGEAEPLIKRAHAAFRSAKQAHHSYRPYQRGTFDRIERRLSLDAALRRAFQRQAFTLHFQPQLDLGSGQVVGAEVLLRWPESPDLAVEDLVSVMEETGLILPVGRWVLEQARDQHRRWCEEGRAPGILAVNLSARQFRDPQLAAHLRGLTGADPWLELEVTESSIMEDVHSARELLTTLRDLGIRVAVDDFGTGYSSLSQLKRLPIDTLKVDRTFVHELESHPDDRAITGAILAMGQRLGLCTLAEGVETEAQRHWLEEQGCRLAQGFLIGRPLPAAEYARRFLPVLASEPAHQAQT